MNKLLLWLWRVLPLPNQVQSVLMWLVNRKLVVGTSALILNQHSEVLLFKHSYRIDTPWGFPGGYLKKREDPADTIQREILEESGLHIRIIKLLEVVQSPHAFRLEILYLAELMGDGLNFKPSVEVCDARFFSLDRLPKLLRNMMQPLSGIYGRRSDRQNGWVPNQSSRNGVMLR